MVRTSKAERRLWLRYVRGRIGQGVIVRAAKASHPCLGFPAYTSILQRLCVYTARYFPCWSNGITATNARPLAVSFIAVSKAVRYCFDIKSAVISSTAYCDDVDWARTAGTRNRARVFQASNAAIAVRITFVYRSA